MTLMVPSMILQPLIENAIYHGLKGGAHRGNVWIREYREGDDLYIEVRDNGRGMREEEIASLNRSLEEGGRDSHGVGNVHRRVVLICGSEYGLQYSQNAEGGLLVTIHLPAVMDERDDCVLRADCGRRVHHPLGLRCMIPWATLGFSEVLEASSAEVALRVTEETRVDLIVTDICMPAWTAWR
jgi:CheY-like chemotaxis protein